MRRGPSEIEEQLSTAFFRHLRGGNCLPVSLFVGGLVSLINGADGAGFSFWEGCH